VNRVMVLSQAHDKHIHMSPVKSLDATERPLIPLEVLYTLLIRQATIHPGMSVVYGR
jgi:hypothetical protein